MTTGRQTEAVLAIDLGTSGPKVALVSTEGAVLAHEFEPNELLLLPGGGAEQRPSQWWDTIVRASRRLLSRKLVPVDSIVAVCCTSQWSGTVPVDREGAPLHNAIIWMDSRGATHIKPVVGGLLSFEGYGLLKIQRWIRLTGGAPGHSGKDPLAHILWLKHEHPDIYERAYKFLEPKDYLNLKLTGEFLASYDSITLHWVTDNRDLSNVRYDDGLLAMAGIAREKLPDLRPANHVIGPISRQAADELGVPHDAKVVIGTPDVQSATIGSGAVRDYEAHVYIGTSSWLTCHVPFKKTDLIHNMASLPAAIPGRYFLANEQETAGKCLAALADNILCRNDALTTGKAPENPLQIFDGMAAEVPAGSDKLIFLPWLYGERTPVEDHSVRGGFFNFSLDTNRAHLVRAVMEGVAYNSRWLLEAVEKFISRRLPWISMIGGGAKSEIWCQIYADVLDRTIRQVENPIEANVRGAGFLALVALGYMTYDDIAGRVNISRTFEPNSHNRGIYDQLYREFLNLYRSNKSIYARLNG